MSTTTETTETTPTTNRIMADETSFSPTSVSSYYFASMQNDPDLAPPKLKRSYCEESKIMEKIYKEFMLDDNLKELSEVDKFTIFS